MPDAFDVVQDKYCEAACFSFAISGYAPVVLARLRPEHFVSYEGNLRLLMEAVEEMQTEGVPISLVSVRERLQTKTVERDGRPVSLLALMGGGAGSLREGDRWLNQIATLFPVRDGQVWFDRDGEGIQADPANLVDVLLERSRRRRLLATLSSVTRGLIDPESGMTADLACQELGEVMSESVKGIEYATRSLADNYERQVSRIRRLATDERIGTPTGFASFDQLTGGLHGNDYLKILAADKNCKSQLALTIALHAVKRYNEPILYITPEMTADLIHDRLISMSSNRRLPYGKLVNKVTPLTREEEELALEIWDEVSRYPLYIIDSLRSEREIIPEVERVIRERGIRGVVWDYWQKFEVPPGKTDEQGWTQLSKAISALGQRHTARGHDLWNIVIDQMNDEGAKVQRLIGKPMSAFSYMSKQANKDATIKTGIMVEPERFSCYCPEQSVDRLVFDPIKGEKPIKVPRWDYRPPDGVCPDCEAAGRDPRIWTVNQVREGRWFIEGGRNIAGGVVIDLNFDGRYMLLEERKRAARGPSPSPAPGSLVPFEDEFFR